MNNLYEIENRLLIPNWRDFKRTIKIGELGGLNLNKEFDFDNSVIKNDWENNKTIGVAADLINNSFISNELNSDELKQAINFVEKNSNNASSSLLSLVKQIKSEVNSISDNSNIVLEKKIDSIEEFYFLLDNDLLNKIISKTKNLTKKYLSNSIYWIELARLYTIKGQLSKAEKCINIALNLSPNNRFVLRSATRFFIHSNEEEKAIYFLKNSQVIKNDPWLISAHIAVSKLIDRYSPYIKNGNILLKSSNYSNFDLTELSSSLGTLEIESGSFKKSKQLFELSMIDPNDNSLAQYEWLSKKENRFVFDAEKFKTVKNPFEAFAYENFKKGNFKESFNNCIDWFSDIPFSKRPLIFATYIATLLEQNDYAILLCKFGLKYDNTEFSFINNLVYNYCIKNNIQEAEFVIENHLKKRILNNLTNEEKITLQATLGLLYLRSEKIEEGKNLYKLALENSSSIKNEYYYNLILINFTRELHKINDTDFKYYFDSFKDIKSEDIDVNFQKNNVYNDILISLNMK